MTEDSTVLADDAITNTTDAKKTNKAGMGCAEE